MDVLNNKSSFTFLFLIRYFSFAQQTRSMRIYKIHPRQTRRSSRSIPDSVQSFQRTDCIRYLYHIISWYCSQRATNLLFSSPSKLFLSPIFVFSSFNISFRTIQEKSPTMSRRLVYVPTTRPSNPNRIKDMFLANIKVLSVPLYTFQNVQV